MEITIKSDFTSLPQLRKCYVYLYNHVLSICLSHHLSDKQEAKEEMSEGLALLNDILSQSISEVREELVELVGEEAVNQIEQQQNQTLVDTMRIPKKKLMEGVRRMQEEFEIGSQQSQN